MRHTDPARLTTIALGDTPADAEEADHLRGCAVCGDELDALRRVAAVARAAGGERGLPGPGAPVWDRIASEVDEARGGARVVAMPGPPRRARRWVLAAAAAVVLGAVAVGGVVALSRQDAPPATERVDVVATTALDRLPSAPPGAAGVAEVVRTSGRLELRLRMTGMPRPAGLYQVWLYDGGRTMIPLGVLSGASSTMRVPAGVSIADYPIVDVSEQALGQQEHGVSVLRGRLG